MIAKLLMASFLVATTVIIHAAGLGMVLSHTLHSTDRPDTRFWSITWLLIRIAWFLIVIHLLEIGIWALFFWWQNCLPDAGSSFYFSGVTYATIGYGDLVLPKEWQLFGPLEGLTGILMCGLSTAFFFVILSKKILELHGRSGSGGFVIPGATGKKEIGRASDGPVDGACDTKHGVVLVSISGVDSTEQSVNE